MVKAYYAALGVLAKSGRLLFVDVAELAGTSVRYYSKGMIEVFSNNAIPAGAVYTTSDLAQALREDGVTEDTCFLYMQ